MERLADPARCTHTEGLRRCAKAPHDPKRPHLLALMRTLDDIQGLTKEVP